jgi:DNA repair protein RecO (recombination protein O)
MNILRTCGIVLRVTGHGESDKLVTLYTPDLGRITGIAKGAQKSRRRFVNKLEAFSHLLVFYRPPRGAQGLLLINEAELLAAHIPLRTDVQRYAAAMYLCELIVRFTHDNDPDPQLYTLFKWAIAALDHDKMPARVVALAHLQLLERVGYRPELNCCSRCRQLLRPEHTYMLLPGVGALLCNLCSSSKRSPFPPLSVHTLRLLSTGQTLPLDRLHRLHFTPKSLAEALSALNVYTLHLLQQDVHSWSIFCALGIGQNCAPQGRETRRDWACSSRAA